MAECQEGGCLASWGPSLTRLPRIQSRQWLAQVLEASTDHSRLALEALGIAQELCAKAAGTRGTRQAYLIGELIAQEHLAAGDAATAHKLLLLVAGESPRCRKASSVSSRH